MLFRPLFLCVAIAHATITINYGAFTQIATYSIANQLGFFKAIDLDVVYNQVPNSTFAYAELLSGGYDILTGTIDNAVNLRFNSQENVTVLGQLDQGPDLVLASIPSITSVAQLKGKPLIVDSPVSGYAYLLRKVLSSYNLSLENGDYFFQTVGGTNLRYADLIAGALPNGTAVYATILIYPFTAEGKALPTEQQPNILARVSEFVNPISSSAFTTRQSALDNQTEVESLALFVGAMYAASRILQDPVYKQCSTIAIQNQLGVSVTAAALEYSAATSIVSGEVSPAGNFTVSLAGLENIIAMREEFGGFKVPSTFNFDAAIVPGKGKLIDYLIRDVAVTGANYVLSYADQAC